MSRRRKQFLSRGVFHQLSKIHNCHTITQMLHYIHGMGDKQIGNAIFFLKIQKQVDNLRLDRNIQGRYCFITNNKLGLKSQGLCNSDSLALTAGKFMGVSICICLLYTSSEPTRPY